MLMTIAVILLIMWLLGMVSSYTLGGFVHLLLVLAIIVILIRVIQKGSGIPGGRSRPVAYSCGTTPHDAMNDSSAPSEGWFSSRRNATTLTAISANVTTGA